MSINIKKGDFTGLADNYSKYRPDYSLSVLKAILSYTGKRVENIDFADVGAGTGIWTRMVCGQGVRSAYAIEPNDDMRAAGQAYPSNADSLAEIKWAVGSAEKTNLESNSLDILTMASSFHWADFEKATKEFNRVLRDGGLFVALWNPRLIEKNPVLVDIENQLCKLKHDIERVSSGRSGITDTLADRLSESPYFDDVLYLEGRHCIRMSKERYMGAWRSVNDLQAQLGSQLFEDFLKYVEDKISELDVIEATYLTRAWVAKNKR
ncbi:class I SAM-dependent methyltransferase [Aeromonas diversa]|uniref:class I SAM-dependent methyltransferase n=1 Tax=Aeromonas diversa TaxID=502790 RepID=UPI0039A00AEC